MAKDSKIEWTDHTVNFYIGCRKVSPACTNCYAGTLVENRMGKPFYPPPGLGRVALDADSPVWRTKTWGDPLKWQREAAAAGQIWRVFTCSLSDFFLDHPDVHVWRREAWKTIRDTPNLLWLVLSKRYGYGLEYLLSCLPDDWGAGYPNVMLGATVENQETARRLEVACRIPTQRGIFASCEPLLGPIDLRPYFGDRWTSPTTWVISGGESGSKARPTHPAWTRMLRDHAVAAGVEYHHKQNGEWVTAGRREDFQARKIIMGGNGHIREVGAESFYDDDVILARLGKKAAGRLLDGRTWDGGPV